MQLVIDYIISLIITYFIANNVYYFYNISNEKESIEKESIKYTHLLAIQNFVLVLLSVIYAHCRRFNLEIRNRSICFARGFIACMVADYMVELDNLYGSILGIILYMIAYCNFGIEKHSRMKYIIRFIECQFWVIQVISCYFIELVFGIITCYYYNAISKEILFWIHVYSLLVTIYLAITYFPNFRYHIYKPNKSTAIIFLGTHLFVLFNHMAVYRYLVFDSIYLNVLSKICYSLGLICIGLGNLQS